jgi:hypothetical protein
MEAVMPAQKHAHVWANKASVLYLRRSALVRSPDENLCADCLFEIWYDQPPTDPVDITGQFTHFRRGSRDPRWETLVQGNTLFTDALRILKTGVQNAHEKAIAGVA